MQRPIIDPCTTLPILGYVINITVTLMNGNQENYISKFIYDTEGDSMGMFTFYYSQLFNEVLLPNTVYELTVFPTNRLGELLILYSYFHKILCLDTYIF